MTLNVAYAASSIILIGLENENRKDAVAIRTRLGNIRGA